MSFKSQTKILLWFNYELEDFSKLSIIIFSLFFTGTIF